LFQFVLIKLHIITLHRCTMYVGCVQLASDFRKRLRAAISCHLTQTSKEST